MIFRIQDYVESSNFPLRMGGTYAYKDIAFEFASWVSPQFKLYLIREFERLKKEEQALLGWSAKRELAKNNYRIHTDAIKVNLIPPELTPQQTSIIYVPNRKAGSFENGNWREFLSGNLRKSVYGVKLKFHNLDLDVC